MERLLSDLITNTTLRQKLEKSGYENVTDIKDVGVVQVTEELQLSKEEVQIILKLVHGGHILASQTAEDRIKSDNQKTGISFSCKAFDELFDRYKGVPPSCITDFCGEPGSGKTQICMQLAVNAPECIYIDTEGSLFPGRLRQLAETIVITNKREESDKPSDVEFILKNIHVFRVCDHVQLIALIRQLSDILDEFNQVKLLILDSITYPLRTNIDIKLRNNILAFVGQNLAQLASRHKLAVVVTNHVKEDHLNIAVTPALGEDWGKRCANRFFLYRTREQRYARYYKSSLGTKDTTVHFKITNDGLKDTLKDEEQNHIIHDDESNSFKQFEQEEEDVWETSHFTDQVISQIPSQENSQEQKQTNGQFISNNALSSSLHRLKRKRDKGEEQQLSSSRIVNINPSVTITNDSNTTTTIISNNQAREEQPEKYDDDDDDEFGWGSEDEEDALFFAAYDSP
ncbi:P-loop containing nucleoside triphosphate hydrolase protein [Circinella umbellata]|nr:P-loop containing nucleoside triphosphate hydrolase protein [Circinella umbellata]